MKNQLLAIKTLFRFRTYTIINIIGLAVSVAATLIIVRYIHQEVTVDCFNKDLNRLYFLTAQMSNGNVIMIDNEERNNDPNYIDPLQHPEVEGFSYCISFNDDYIIIDGGHHQANVLVTDSMFLQLMDYPVVSGIKTIKKPDDAIITQKYAQYLFGDEDPLGKQFVSSAGYTLTICGIVEEPSTKASLHFDLITPCDQGKFRDWGRMGFCVVRLVEGVTVKQYNDKISKPQSLMLFGNLPIQFKLFPIKDFYFDKTVKSSSDSFLRGNKDHITILSIVACMLLLVGIFNFINIYTVIVLKRAREFGVKKVYGANAFQIFIQIYVENVYMVAISLLAIWTLIEITTGMFDSVYAIPVKSDIKFDLILSFILLLGLPLITSIYPFLRYTYSSPITSLRSISIGGHSIISRVAFLFVQYIITFCLIVVALFFIRQLNMMLHTDLGYRTKDIVTCQFLSDKTYYSREETEKEWNKRRETMIHQEQVIKQKMDECPLFVSWAYGILPINKEINLEFTYNGEKHKMATMVVNKKYMDILGLKLEQGREWNDSDQSKEYKMIINETAQRLFNIKNIKEASLLPESRLWWEPGPNMNLEENPPLQVIGVVKDFRTGHLSKGDVPLAILFDKNDRSLEPLIANIVEGKRKEAIQFLKQLYNEVIGEGEFTYSFVEDEVKKLYDEDKRITRIYVTFAGLAIFISCLGLFGLSLYDIRQRYREIALRKVNGATNRQVVLLLVRKYLYILGAAFFVAIPLSYYIIDDYTKDFVVKAPIEIGVFVIGFMLTLLISLGTLLWQVCKAVRLNPGTIMKTE